MIASEIRIRRLLYERCVSYCDSWIYAHRIGMQAKPFGSLGEMHDRGRDVIDVRSHIDMHLENYPIKMFEGVINDGLSY